MTAPAASPAPQPALPGVELETVWHLPGMPYERAFHAWEEHLEECPRCSRSVRSKAGGVGPPDLCQRGMFWQGAVALGMRWAADAADWN